MPVTASMRRMPAATPASPRILKEPMSPVRTTCVPPQSSTELPIVSTRTMSPYFSPKSIVAPVLRASSSGRTSAFVDLLVDEVFDAGDLLGRHGLAVGEVEAQLGRGDEGALLFDVLAEDLTQGLLEKVGR